MIYSMDRPGDEDATWLRRCLDVKGVLRMSLQLKELGLWDLDVWMDDGEQISAWCRLDQYQMARVFYGIYVIDNVSIVLLPELLKCFRERDFLLHDQGRSISMLGGTVRGVKT